MPDDVAGTAQWGTQVRARSFADLASVRSAVRRALVDAKVSADQAADTVLVVSELTTNALTAATAGSTVIVRLRIARSDRNPGHHRVEVDIDNVGDPVHGLLHPTREDMSSPAETEGRGLAIAASLGHVVVEGRIGGTRASFRARASPDDPGRAD